MNRRATVAALAALCVAASSLSAQVQVRLTAPNAPGASRVSWDPPGSTPTIYVSPYTGLLVASHETVILNCVDFFHNAALNTTYWANVSSLDGSLVNTRFNNTQAYLQAAWLSQQYNFPNPGANSDFSNRTIAIQAAIWNILTPSAPDRVYGSNPSDNAYDHAWWINQSLLHWRDVNPGNFYILTPTNARYANGADNPSSFQEFLVYRETVTPEPATIALLGTSLVGLVGVSRRRRNKENRPVS